MAKKKYYASMETNPRRQEYEAAGMISEDRSAIANLPQNVIMREYPKAPYGNQYGLEDTIRGVDYQMGQDARSKEIKKGPMPEKY